jgi:iron complex outermembrane receptor protein
MRRGPFHDHSFCTTAIAVALMMCAGRAEGQPASPPPAPPPAAPPIAPPEPGAQPAQPPVAPPEPGAEPAQPAEPPSAPPGESPGPPDDQPSDQPGDASATAPIVVDAVEVSAPAAPDSAGAAAPAAARGLEDTAFVTEVQVRDHAAETTSVAEVLARTMGVSVRSLGGLGGFSSLSVRGADPGNTAVFVDGVPLSRVASATINLERFALESFSTLELYRGGVPVELGGAALGGALQLRTRVGVSPGDAPWTFTAGAGSFGARRLHARWLGGSAADGHHLSLAYAGASGDFSYFDHNGTDADTSDDHFATRENNHFDRIEAVARKRWQRDALAIEAGARWSFARQGIPGGTGVPVRHAALTTIGQLADASVTQQSLLGSPRLVGTASGFLDLSWQHYRDPEAEVGVGAQDRTYRTVSAGVNGRVHVDLGPQHMSALGLELQVDHFRERDALAMAGASLRSRGMRTGAAASASHEWTAGERLTVHPAVRLDWLRTVPLADPNDPGNNGDLVTRSEVLASPRLAARVRLASALVAKASAGRYFRPPTVLELFGDRGYVVGDPSLPSEAGLSADLGLVLAPARAFHLRGLAADRLYLETAAFTRRSRHTIGFVTTAGVSGARDLGDAQAHGIETGASARLAGMITLSGNHTWLTTRQESPIVSYDGKPLPGRPRHQIFGRVDATGMLRGRRASVWADALWTTGNVLDRAGLNHVPGRELLGAGLAIEIAAGLQLGLEGKNLTNHRVETIAWTDSPRAVADYFGYPLPGRTFYVTAEWRP